MSLRPAEMHRQVEPRQHRLHQQKAARRFPEHHFRALLCQVNVLVYVPHNRYPHKRNGSKRMQHYTSATGQQLKILANAMYDTAAFIINL